VTSVMYESCLSAMKNQILSSVSCSFFLVDFVGAGLVFYSNWLLLSLSLVSVLVFLSSPPRSVFLSVIRAALDLLAQVFFHHRSGLVSLFISRRVLLVIFLPCFPIFSARSSPPGSAPAQAAIAPLFSPLPIFLSAVHVCCAGGFARASC
jgi:hypothetical protein